MALQLVSKRLNIKEPNDPAASFVIERLLVPDAIEQISFAFIPYQEAYVIDSFIVYDSNYNVRVDIQNICGSRKIILSRDKLASSTGTRVGPIPAGEWIVVFKLALPKPNWEWLIEYEVQAQPLITSQMSQ
ncbi:hypothetical protein [Facklamia miroungae]|uniref:SLAP domain-containing protein n=1 Tax=Facklamia miroungae TaxID=120956 RepID=A0A1G7RH93_9LACT|nr:hypothetical protein [Facklamia miroungae]NKZ29414.1 hypothetical protein [Facklamia miroungae]SDG10121.1 hypothetical protein SAMN05421791_10341 [Facklamia miroungae]